MYEAAWCDLYMQTDTQKNKEKNDWIKGKKYGKGFYFNAGM